LDKEVVLEQEEREQNENINDLFNHHRFTDTMDKLKITRPNQGRVFNSRREHVCACRAVAFLTKTAYLKVENSAQTTLGISSLSLFLTHTPHSNQSFKNWF